MSSPLSGALSREMLSTPSKTHSGHPPTPPTNAADAMLQDGFQRIRAALDQKQQTWHQYASYWKQQAQTLSAQVQSLQASLEQSNRRIASLETRLQNTERDRDDIVREKQRLETKYSVLKKSAVQLESFRKQIATMVEFSPNVLVGPDKTFMVDENMDINADHTVDEEEKHKHHQHLHLEDPFVSFSSPEKIIQISRIESAETLPPKETLHLTPFQPASTEEHQENAKLPKKRTPKQQKPTPKTASPITGDKTPKQKTPSRTPKQESSFWAENSLADISVDAPSLYRQIRSLLTPSAFEDFAQTIAMFNAGSQTPDKTIKRLAELIPEAKLVKQMRTLILRSVAESSISH